MKKKYIEPRVSVLTVESQPMMAASDPENFDPTPSKGSPVKGSQATSNAFQFFEEEGEL